MKLSIALCTYNGAQYLPEQLASFVAQVRLPDELIVFDDCSADDTRAIVESFAAEAPFPVQLHVNQERLGSTKNFECAIARCTGEIIALADQDDVWHPEKLRRTEAAFAAAPAVGLVFTDALVVDEALHPLGHRLSQCLRLSRRERQLLGRGRAFSLLLRGNIICGATTAFRAQFKPLVLPIATTGQIVMLHDGWITLLIAAVADVAFIREPLILYRQHGRQQLGTCHRPTRLPFRRALKFAQRTGSSPYSAWARLFELIHERVSASSSDALCQASLRHLEAGIRHLRRRENMPRRRLRRLPLILEELLTRRYDVYSNSVFSAIRDLWV